jgi:hypothetical protein
LEEKINGKILGMEDDKRLIRDAREIADESDSTMGANTCSSPTSPGMR